jgi:hypothetical protein
MTVSGVFMVTASLCGRPAPLVRRTLTPTQPSLFEGTKMEPRWNPDGMAGAPGWDAGVFLDCAAARKRESGYSVCADALSAAFLPWAASAVDGRRTQPGHVCRGFFHCNADVVPLCCRKAATKGRRVLCAATDASSLPPQRQHSGLRRLATPGIAISAGAIFWRQRSCSGGRGAEAYRTKSGIFSDYFANEKPSAKPPPLAIRA